MKNILPGRKWVFLILLILISAKRVQVTVQISIDREEISIGDTFVLTIEVKNIPGVKLGQFDPAEYLTAFEMKDFDVDEPRRRFGREIRTYTYKLSTFLSGTYTIPRFDIPYMTREGIRESVQSPELKVEIKPVEPREGEKDDIRDIKSVQRIPVHAGVLILVVIIITAVAGTWIGLYIRKLRKLKELSKTYEMQRPPDEIAFERLIELKNHNLVADGNIVEYYIVLAEIIRHYVSRRYSISVMDKTTLELFKDLRFSKSAKKYSADIKYFLSQCDLVKFARYLPEIAVVEEDHAKAVDIITQTREVKTAEESGAAV